MNPSSAASCKVNELYFKTYGAEIDRQNMEYLNSLLVAKSESDTKNEHKIKRKKSSNSHHMRTKSTIPMTFHQRAPPSPSTRQAAGDPRKIPAVLESPNIQKHETNEATKFIFPKTHENGQNQTHFRGKMPMVDNEVLEEKTEENNDTCIGILSETKEKEEPENKETTSFLTATTMKGQISNIEVKGDRKTNGNFGELKEGDMSNKQAVEKFSERIGPNPGSHPTFPMGRGAPQCVLLSPQKLLAVDLTWNQKKKINQKDFTSYNSRKYHSSQQARPEIGINDAANEQINSEEQNFIKISSHRGSAPEKSNGWLEKNISRERPSAENQRSTLNDGTKDIRQHHHPSLEQKEREKYQLSISGLKKSLLKSLNSEKLETETCEEPVQMLTSPKPDLDKSIPVDDNNHNPSLATIRSHQDSNYESNTRENCNDLDNSNFENDDLNENNLRKSLPPESHLPLHSPVKWENPISSNDNSDFLVQLKGVLDYFSKEEAPWNEMAKKHSRNKVASPHRQQYLESSYLKSTVMLKKLSFENLNLKKKLDFFEQTIKALKNQNHELLKRLEHFYEEKEVS